MSISFPANPVVGQIFTLGTKSWKFNGKGWELQSISDAQVQRAETAATSAAASAATALGIANALGGNTGTASIKGTWFGNVIATVAQLGSSIGASLIGFIQPGTGATARSVADKLQDLETSINDYGVVADGTNQKAKLQAAINAISAAGGGTLKFAPGVTIVSAGLTPKPGVILDLNGSTLKLADSTNSPLFFDGGAPQGTGLGFSVINGTLDCNQAANNGLNVVGGIWLTGWKNLDFRRLIIKNCYRIGINLINCNWFSVRDYQFINSGNDDGAGFYAYALNVDGSADAGAVPAGSRYFTVDGMAVSNVAGYGIHFIGVSDFSAKNLSFNTLNYKSQSEAITFTSCARFATENVSSISNTGDAIEVNSCFDGTFSNYNVQQAGNRALLIGLNGTGTNSARLRFNNFSTTGTVGTYAASLSYLEECEFNDIKLDKPVSRNTSATTDFNNVIRNADIASTAGGSVALINYAAFNLEYVRFTDYIYRYLGRQKVAVSMAMTLVNTSGAYVIDPSAILPGMFSNTGVAAGRLTTLSYLSGSANQGSRQYVDFYLFSVGATKGANLGTVSTLAGGVSRALTITGDATNVKINLANVTAVDLKVVVDIEFNTYA